VNTTDTGSNAMPEFSGNSQTTDSRTIVPATISETRLMRWSVRRELLENRSIYVAPLAVAAVILFSFSISLVHFPARMRAMLALNTVHQRALEQPYNFAALLIMGTTFVVAIFYCLDALHGERRDRSILFWKSLPVSDLTTVLSKASIPLLILPLLTFTITVATHWIMLLLSTAVLAGSGLSVGMLWSNLPVFHMWGMLLYHLLAGHGLYYAPIYGWLLLVSGWARRAVFLWAALPLVAIGVIEKVALNSSHFVDLLASRIQGGGGAMGSQDSGQLLHPLTLQMVTDFLSSPGLWIGLALAAAFLAAAAQLRRYQGPI
jgi:ABC-2 type transport system permease protein